MPITDIVDGNFAQNWAHNAGTWTMYITAPIWAAAPFFPGSGHVLQQQLRGAAKHRTSSSSEFCEKVALLTSAWSRAGPATDDTP